MKHLLIALLALMLIVPNALASRSYNVDIGGDSDVNVNARPKDHIAQAAPQISIPQQNAGLQAYTPFGGVSHTDVAEVHQLTVAAQLINSQEVPQWIKDQVAEAVKPCSLLGIPLKALERQSLGLGGFLCWSQFGN